VPASATRPTRAKKVTGLRYWMLQVLKECDHVAADFKADPVHDLRVSLRRCRSLADGLMALDSNPDWKAMKKAGKGLFRRLGDLRDVQVMMEWVDKLHPSFLARRASPATSPASAGSPNATTRTSPSGTCTKSPAATTPPTPNPRSWPTTSATSTAVTGSRLLAPFKECRESGRLSYVWRFPVAAI